MGQPAQGEGRAHRRLEAQAEAPAAGRRSARSLPDKPGPVERIPVKHGGSGGRLLP